MDSVVSRCTPYGPTGLTNAQNGNGVKKKEKTTSNMQDPFGGRAAPTSRSKFLGLEAKKELKAYTGLEPVTREVMISTQSKSHVLTATLISHRLIGQPFFVLFIIIYQCLLPFPANIPTAENYPMLAFSPIQQGLTSLNLGGIRLVDMNNLKDSPKQ